MAGTLRRRAMLRLLALMGGAAAAPVRAQPITPAPKEEELMEALERRAVAAIGEAAEPLPPIEEEGFARLVDRHADARVICLGESTHGTSEFYRARAAITERLVSEHGFTAVAVEADWPDAGRIDAHIRGREELPQPISPFRRFPVWMWRNRPVRALVDRLHEINGGRQDGAEIGFYGLDLYSLPSSMDAVIDFVARHEPGALDEVRERYGCLAPWVDEPARYGALARTPELDSCAEEVVSVLEDVLRQRMGSLEEADPALFQALGNARVVAASEAYHRAMHAGSVESWNLRDTHMFETLRAVLEARGPGSKAVVWAHNSHIGDASATGMGMRGEINLGELCRREWGDDAVLIGFGTDRGTVTAAPRWGGPTETRTVLPSRPDSWGALMARAEPERFFLDIRGGGDALASALGRSRLERFIGVIYRPETELLSHYSEAVLGRQFDGYVWFRETEAVEPLPAAEVERMPATYPFAL